MKSSIKLILTTLFLGIGLCLIVSFGGFGVYDKTNRQNQSLAVWDTVVLPLARFNVAQLEAQEQANRQESVIRCFAPIGSEINYTNIDFQDITPQTWRWVRLEHQKPDGTRSIISLRRPNAWLLAIRANAIGKQIYLELPEMGIVGNAKILAFASNHLDTRLWESKRQGDFIDRPITGKFEHQSPTVLWLNCTDTEAIGTTPTHPFWSKDRQQWVQANDLRVGEHLRTQSGETVLTQKRLEHQQTTVYNLEVYRGHNYLVSSNGVLVHNQCPNTVNGNTPATQLGREKHREFKSDEVSDTKLKEYTLPSGKRVDFIDFDNKAVWELKPNNKRAKKLGAKQLNEYKNEIESIHGKGWSSVLDTYQK